MKKIEGAKGNIDRIDIWQNYVFKFRQDLDSLIDLMEISYPDYYRLKHNRNIASINTIQFALEDSSAFLAYFLGTNKLYTFLITQDTFQVFSYTSKPILTALETLRQMFLHYEDPVNDQQLKSQFRQFVQIARNLYKLVLAPALNQLNGINKLILIPDGELGYLPFELLLSKDISAQHTRLYAYENLPYLVNSFEVRYEYSGTILLEQNKGSAAKQLYGGFAPEFDDLTYNQSEVRQAADLFSGKHFIGMRASKGKFEDLASEYRILHLATHAYIHDSLPLYSHLVFSEKK